MLSQRIPVDTVSSGQLMRRLAVMHLHRYCRSCGRESHPTYTDREEIGLAQNIYTLGVQTLSISAGLTALPSSRLTSLPTPSWNAALAALRTPTSLSKHAARIRAVAISGANGSKTDGEHARESDHNR
jgi:hypothetical protein